MKGLLAVMCVCFLWINAEAQKNQQYWERGFSDQYRAENTLGQYAFGYNEDHTSGGSFRRETGDRFGNKVGSYGLRIADGRIRIVNYVADHNGYRADVMTNEPGMENQKSNGYVEVTKKGFRGAMIPGFKNTAEAPHLTFSRAGHENRQPPMKEQRDSFKVQEPQFNYNNMNGQFVDSNKEEQADFNSGKIIDPQFKQGDMEDEQLNYNRGTANDQQGDFKAGNSEEYQVNFKHVNNNEQVNNNVRFNQGDAEVHQANFNYGTVDRKHATLNHGDLQESNADFHQDAINAQVNFNNGNQEQHDSFNGAFNHPQANYGKDSTFIDRNNRQRSVEHQKNSMSWKVSNQEALSGLGEENFYAPNALDYSVAESKLVAEVTKTQDDQTLSSVSEQEQSSTVGSTEHPSESWVTESVTKSSLGSSGNATNTDKS